MKYFSTFSGIGGFELGIERAALSVRNGATQNTNTETSEQGLESTTESLRHNGDKPDTKLWGDSGQVSCVGYSEIDKYASSVYEYHNPGTKNYGDITKINADELPDFELLVGGFPCQAFSIAGKRRGFEDTRGTLFFDLARILKAKTPRLFVFENVKGLLSHDNGNTFKTIIATIDELGYDCQWQVINSKNHGVPQNRERIYIVGHLRGTPRPKVFPITGDDREATQLQGQYTNTLTARYEGAQAVGSYIANAVTTGSTHTVGSYVAESKLDAQEIDQLNNPKHSNDRVYGSGGVSPTLNTMQGGNRQPFVSEPPKIRRLTPIECERLQGFPDNWTATSTNGAVSDTQRYKMCGNAVTTNVVQAVFERILA